MVKTQEKSFTVLNISVPCVCTCYIYPDTYSGPIGQFVFLLYWKLVLLFMIKLAV